MMNHWQITALGMGTVFLALIALSCILSLFPLIFRKPEKKHGELFSMPELSEPTVRAVQTQAAPLPPGAPGRDAGTELVAVIAAAVAASSGMAPGSFSVSSVAAVADGAAEAGGFNTPVWGHIDRLYRA